MHEIQLLHMKMLKFFMFGLYSEGQRGCHEGENGKDSEDDMKARTANLIVIWVQCHQRSCLPFLSSLLHLAIKAVYGLDNLVVT